MVIDLAAYPRHLTLPELKAFLAGELRGTRRARRLLRHWLKGCRECGAVVARHARGLRSDGKPPDPAEYDAPVDRALARAAAVAREREALRATVEPWVEHFWQTQAEPEAFFAATPREVVEYELSRCWRFRYTDSVLMGLWATLAAQKAAELTPDDCGGEAELADLRCRAVLNFANALRINDDLDQAEATFQRAFEWHAKGTENPLLLADIHQQQSSLWAARRRWPEAQAALDQALRIYRLYRLPHLQGRTLINKGLYAGYAQEQGKALPLLRKGLRLIDREHDADLGLAAQFNLASFTADLGRLAEAQQLAFGLGPQFAARGQVLNELRVRWLSAKIDWGLGNPERAERDYLAVRDGFQAASRPYPACIVALELAVMWRSLGKWEPALELMHANVKFFLSLRIPDYLLVSIAAFREGFLRRRTSRKALVAVLDHCLRAARNDEPPPRKAE